MTSYHNHCIYMRNEIERKKSFLLLLALLQIELRERTRKLTKIYVWSEVLHSFCEKVGHRSNDGSLSSRILFLQHLMELVLVENSHTHLFLSSSYLCYSLSQCWLSSRISSLSHSFSRRFCVNRIDFSKWKRIYFFT